MPKSRTLTYQQAINEALMQEMRKDPTVVLIGEDIWWEGGTFGVTKGLPEEFGADRVRDVPISEATFIGTAVGAAATGLRPVAELMFLDFYGVCMDQIYNQAAKLRYMTGGGVKVPLTIRAAMGSCEGLGEAAQHSQCLYSIFVHIPGLFTVAPSTPYDAKGLLVSSIRQDDPVIFCEHKCLYNVAGEVPEDEYTIPLGKADVKREGEDVTVVAISRMVHLALDAATKLSQEGINVEIIDPRTLFPLDEETILRSVMKTGRLVIVDEDYPRCSLATDISACICEHAFDYLDAPIRLVQPPHTPVPFSPTLEKSYLPNSGKIVKTVKEII